jgi:hypothetical protein
MVVVQELSDRDMANRSTVADRLNGNLSDDVINLMTDETHRIFTVGQRKIHSSSINGLFIVHVWVFGVEWQTSES